LLEMKLWFHAFDGSPVFKGMREMVRKVEGKEKQG
jgi:hypothetical protein